MTRRVNCLCLWRLLRVHLLWSGEAAVRRNQLLVCSVTALTLMLFNVSIHAEEPLAGFMRAKLTHSEKTLEGLTKGDFQMIAKHSQTISLLCEDELWSVMQTTEYRDRTKEFQRSVNAITDAARQKNLEAATLAYVNTTMHCVTCHKYVRDNRPKPKE